MPTRHSVLGVGIRVGIRVPIRIRFGSIRVSDFRVQRFQPHSGISKFLFGFGSGSDNPFKLF